MRSLHIGAQRASIRGSILLAVVGASLLLAFGTPVASASSPWTSTTARRVEAYYLRLFNCTRTGGWVRSDGSCTGYGTGKYSKYVAPLKLSSGISDRVSRPYAKVLATRNLCGHNYDHDAGYRFRRGGYSPSWWGENIGCMNGTSNTYSAVLWAHLQFQSEKSANGGHWRNIKNPNYRWIGIGVWYSSGRTRLVTDFYAS